VPLVNDLERPVTERHPVIGALTARLVKLGAVMSAMSAAAPRCSDFCLGCGGRPCGTHAPQDGRQCRRRAAAVQGLKTSPRLARKWLHRIKYSIALRWSAHALKVSSFPLDWNRELRRMRV